MVRKSEFRNSEFLLYIYISAVGSKTKKLAVYTTIRKCSMAYCTYVLCSILRLRTTSGVN